MRFLSLIDFNALTDEERRAAERAIETLRARETDRQQWERLLEVGTDSEILEAASKEFRDAPMTLANRYDKVCTTQECRIVGLFQHPRRPVFLKAAKWVRIRRYSLSAYGSDSPNGWASLIIERAIQMSKATFFEREDYEAFRLSIVKKLHNRYNLSAGFRDMAGRVGGRWFPKTVLIKGRFYDLQPSEIANLKALHLIIQKTEKLDERRDLARAHMMKRLAA